MAILKDSQIIFFADRKYDDVYNTLTTNYKKLNISLKHIFILATAIGFKNSKRIKSEAKGREIRASYLDYREESLLLNMLFTDPEINQNIEFLLDKENEAKIKNLINEYANGGMDLICTNAFEDYWDGEELLSKNEELIYDLSKYILSEIEEVPF